MFLSFYQSRVTEVGSSPGPVVRDGYGSISVGMGQAQDRGDGVFRINHMFRTRDILVSVYDENNFQIIPSGIVAGGVDFVDIDLAGIDTAGIDGWRAVIISKSGGDASVRTYSVSIRPADLVNGEFLAVHGLGSLDAIVQVYMDGELIIPSEIKVVDTSTIIVDMSGTYLSAEVIKISVLAAESATPKPKSYAAEFTNEDLVGDVLGLDHGLDSDAVIVQVYDESRAQVLVSSITIVDSNTVNVSLAGGTPIAGVWSVVVVTAEYVEYYGSGSIGVPKITIVPGLGSGVIGSFRYNGAGVVVSVKASQYSGVSFIVMAVHVDQAGQVVTSEISYSGYRNFKDDLVFEYKTGAILVNATNISPEDTTYALTRVS